jgi:hypothetical protein
MPTQLTERPTIDNLAGFFPLGFPVSDTPTSVQDDNVLGDLYHIKPPSLLNRNAIFHKAIDFREIFGKDSQVTDIVYVSDFPDVNEEEVRSFKASLDLKLQAILNIDVLAESGLKSSVQYKNPKIYNLSSTAFDRLIEAEEIERLVMRYAQKYTENRSNHLYLIEGAIKVSELRIVFSSDKDISVEATLDKAITKGLLKTDLGVDYTVQQNSLVTGQDKYVAFRKNEIARYFPPKRR